MSSFCNNAAIKCIFDNIVSTSIPLRLRYPIGVVPYLRASDHVVG